MATRFTGPIKNRERSRGDREMFSNMPVGPDAIDVITYMNDFLVEQDYAAADWVITTTEDGSGSATEALATDEVGGALVITNDDADDDSDSLQLTQETFKLASGKKVWMEVRAKVSDADAVDAFIGLAVTDTTPLDTTDRVGFQIDDGGASINVLTEKDSTETKTDSGEDAADDTYVKLGMYSDGTGKVEFFVDRAKVATHTANIPDDENLCVTLHLVNGEAAAKSMTVDYIFVCQER